MLYAHDYPDIETVLRIEPTNETAREELGELEELRRKVEVENEARKKVCHSTLTVCPGYIAYG